MSTGSFVEIYHLYRRSKKTPRGGALPLPPPRRHLFVRPGYPEAAIRSIRALSHPCYPYLHQSLADRLGTDKPGVYRCRVFPSAQPIQALAIVRSTGNRQAKRKTLMGEGFRLGVPLLGWSNHLPSALTKPARMRVQGRRLVLPLDYQPNR